MYYFLVNTEFDLDIESIADCKIWIEFEGKSKMWTPKSITIRKLAIEPEHFPVTGSINLISYPIMKFYFSGVLSLTDNLQMTSNDIIKFSHSIQTFPSF